MPSEAVVSDISSPMTMIILLIVFSSEVSSWRGASFNVCRHQHLDCYVRRDSDIDCEDSVKIIYGNSFSSKVAGY